MNEITLDLPPGQTVLVFGNNVVNDLRAKIEFGFYPGEAGAPFKIGLRVGVNVLYEVSIPFPTFIETVQKLVGKFKTRHRIPHQISDK